jgi:hypothetical protein
MSWIDIVAGYLLSKQDGSKNLLGYGETDDVQEVLIPFPNLRRNPREEVNNWTAPSGFKCNSQQDRCNRYRHPGQIGLMGGILLKHPFAPAPSYRFANHGGILNSCKNNTYKDLMKALPGFKSELGMACLLGK